MLSTGVLQDPVGSAQDPGIWCGCAAIFKFHFARWKVTDEENESILGIYTLRYLNDTLSTSSLWQKESIDILGKYLKY